MKKYKKRSYKRKKRKTNSWLQTTGAGKSASFPLNKSFRFKTQYYSAVDLNPSVFTVSHVFSLTGLFDPDITSTGHQPIGFDQVMPMYDHYTVIGARAKVIFTNTDTTKAQTVCLHLRDSATTTTSLTGIIENGMGRYTVLAPAGSGGNVRTLSINCSPSKFFGRKVLQGDKYQGTVASNPSDQCYLHISVSDNAGGDSSVVQCSVLIQYIAILTEPKQLSLS